MTPSWYDILGVAQDAGPDEIKAAWRAATDKFEPGSGNSSQFRMFNDAADVLLDPGRRAAYDASLAGPAAVTAEASPVPVPEPAPKPGKVKVKKAGPPKAEADTFVPAPPESWVEAPLPRAAKPAAGLWLKIATMGVLPVLVAAAVAVAVVLGFKVHQNSETATARSQAPEAADRALTQVLAYNYKDLTVDRNAAVKFLTPDYQKQYLSTYKLLETGKDGKPGPVVTTKTTVTANVLATAVVDADPNEVRVLVYVNQTSTKAGKNPTIFQNRVVATMVKSGNNWLIDNVQSY